ncbi:hypothetical protein ES703_44797 [subsurface metagenome]
MKDPVDMPARSTHRFVCINIVTGHIRNEKTMTAEMALRINSYDHMQGCGYKWLWDDQHNFNDKLLDDTDYFSLR